MPPPAEVVASVNELAELDQTMDTGFSRLYEAELLDAQLIRVVEDAAAKYVPHLTLRPTVKVTIGILAQGYSQRIVLWMAILKVIAHSSCVTMHDLFRAFEKGFPPDHAYDMAWAMQQHGPTHTLTELEHWT